MVLQTLKTTALGRSVSVQDCGLFIDALRPWLAASPDGIVTDSRTGQWLLCLEVKCPYKHRHRSVEDACRDDPAFCLEIQDMDGRRPGGVKKASHCPELSVLIVNVLLSVSRPQLLMSHLVVLSAPRL